MKIFWKNSFKKMYNRLPKNLQAQVDDAIILFVENPNNPQLKVHPLSRNLTGLHAFSAGYDLRIVFEKKGDFVEIIFIKVGSHSAVY